MVGLQALFSLYHEDQRRETPDCSGHRDSLAAVSTKLRLQTHPLPDLAAPPWLVARKALRCAHGSTRRTIYDAYLRYCPANPNALGRGFRILRISDRHLQYD